MLHAINFKDRLTLQHKEKLSRMVVEVACFAGTGRHSLLNHADFGRADKVPAIAIETP